MATLNTLRSSHASQIFHPPMAFQSTWKTLKGIPPGINLLPFFGHGGLGFNGQGLVREAKGKIASCLLVLPRTLPPYPIPSLSTLKVPSLLQFLAFSKTNICVMSFGYLCFKIKILLIKCNLKCNAKMQKETRASI